MKKQKKDKKIEQIIVEVPKTPAFDLSFTRTEENTKIIVALENLKHNSGWQFLTQVFEENLKYLGKQIISKIGEDNHELTEIEVDLIRSKYKYLKEILDKPDYFLKKLRVEDTITENLDPYDS